jgi:hypothetical protein
LTPLDGHRQNIQQDWICLVAQAPPPRRDFGGSTTKVNFFGDGVNYVGDMNFGPNNIIKGYINCNGGEFFAVTPPVVKSGGFVMCPSI